MAPTQPPQFGNQSVALIIREVRTGRSSRSGRKYILTPISRLESRFRTRWLNQHGKFGVETGFLETQPRTGKLHSLLFSWYFYSEYHMSIVISCITLTYWLIGALSA